MNIEAMIDIVMQCKVLPEDAVRVLCRRVKSLLF